MAPAKPSAVFTLVSYWAYNMTQLHNLGIRYPGFGYTDEEKQQLEALAKQVTVFGYMGFGVLNAVYFLGLAGFVMGAGAFPLMFLLDPTHQSGGVFLACMGFGIAVSIGLGLPTSMGLAALTLHAMGKRPGATTSSEPPAPINPSNPSNPITEAVVSALFRRIRYQLLRAGAVAGVLFIPWMIFGLTEAGEHTIAFLQRVVMTLSPFALLLLIVSALSNPKPKP
ncbi:MAG TPA: hypothetical protein PKE31_11730 [Pseudomonadota bacterium]|nr:hypothetical protein [Pseudomonadota bacterium]